MKKILFAAALVLAFGLCADAQRGGSKDGFFTDWDDVSNGLDKFDSFDNNLRDPGFPGHGGGDQPAPLGSGLLVLTALGAGYVLKKKHEK